MAMRELKIVAFIVFFFFCIHLKSNAYENEKELITSIRNVTVYLSGAQIGRYGKTSLQAGNTTLLLKGLPSMIDAQSIQVKGEGDFTILSVMHTIDYLDEQKYDVEIQKLRDELDILNSKVKETNNQNDVYSKEEEMILANKSIGSEQKGVTASELQLMADFFRNRLSDIRQKKLELDKNIQDYNERISKINSQLGDYNSKKNKSTSVILINVSADMATQASFMVQYYVASASWKPRYDIRVKNISSPLNLIYKADVTQSTDESWDNVDLVLSTGNPTLSGTKPELNAWYLDYLKNINAMLEGKAAGLKEVEVVGYGAQEEFEEDKERSNSAKPYSPPVNIEQNQTTYLYKITIPYTIPSNNQAYSVLINELKVNAEYRYAVAPKLDKDAFLTARIPGWESLKLLEGDASIYFEDTYIGQSHLNVINLKDTMDISLGRDKGIIIAREKVKNYTSKQFIGSTIKADIGWEISVRNTRQEKINLVIEDQIPVSINKDISVDEEIPTNAIFDKTTGKILWNLTIDPGKTEKLQFKYSVKYPKDQNIILE
jgi:uncharacterized protein (TIGR02231 family)